MERRQKITRHEEIFLGLVLPEGERRMTARREARYSEELEALKAKDPTKFGFAVFSSESYIDWEVKRAQQFCLPAPDTAKMFDDYVKAFMSDEEVKDDV
jgi:hypothetical protein